MPNQLPGPQSYPQNGNNKNAEMDKIKKKMHKKHKIKIFVSSHISLRRFQKGASERTPDTFRPNVRFVKDSTEFII